MKIYTKYIIALTFIMMFSIVINGQQLAQSSFMEAAKHYWNPGATGLDHNLRTNLFFRQQWVSFNGAPRTGFLSVQYPFIDLNMAAGAIINFDQTGPVSKKGIQFTYAYKLRDILGEDSQLSLGINAGFQQYVFDASSAVFNDFGDELLEGNKASSALFPALGAGIYYLSNTETYRDNVFFVGMAYRNAFTTEVLINDKNQTRERHIHFNVGTRVYQRYSFVEPSITVNYTAPDILDLRLGVRYEMQDVFWAGLGYSSINEASIQGGVILPDFGNRYAKLRVGALANFAVSNNIAEFGPGFEFFVGYIYDID
ncbi:MAG: PorP/SprF family type IX secretion system membrane protein [Saprospiraceae bacterium]